jgi:hypothetical protein
LSGRNKKEDRSQKRNTFDRKRTSGQSNLIVILVNFNYMPFLKHFHVMADRIQVRFNMSVRIVLSKDHRIHCLFHSRNH